LPFIFSFLRDSNSDKGCSLKDIVEGLKGASIRKLTEEEKDNLEGEIGSFEAGEILKKMKNNKSPGSDGFTSEFLKFYDRYHDLVDRYGIDVSHMPKDMFHLS
jgi:hypothetical protein